jgi:hypothetical protein
MFILHYLIPLIIYYVNKNKLILWALISANIIDLGHIYFRLIGKVAWFGSACQHAGMQCSFNFYPFHNLITLIIAACLIPLIFTKKKWARFIGYFGIGIVLHLALDYLHLLIGFGI